MAKERNIRLTLAYDGTGFSGFQRQANTHRTIQEVLEDALSKLTGEDVTLYGAGRTDAGVHALGQVVNFRTQATIPADRWPMAIRGFLPPEIVVHSADEVPLDFHARYSAKGKTYQYRLWRGQWPSIFNQRFSYHYPGMLKMDSIQEAMAFIHGTHDFKAFSAAGTSVKSTVRTVSRIVLERYPDEWVLEISANGFLYHMVRNIVGTLLWVGESRITPEEVKTRLEVGERSRMGPTAPAHGLCLLGVEY